MKILFVVFICSLFISGCSVFGIRTVEEPDYRIIVEEDDFEIREYKGYIVAETMASGDYDESTSWGFRRLADYIFGNNRSRQNIEMTAPVLQEEKSEKMAMTAPVLQEKSGDQWLMAFVMPAKYTLETLPQPVDTLIRIRQVDGKKVAVNCFSGYLSEDNIIENTTELRSWLDEKGYQPVSPPRSAGYDPPWTIPFLRRNEIHIDIE